MSDTNAKGKQMTCKVLLLDDAMPTFQVSYKAMGCDLLEAVVKHLRLLEADYFSLEYKDPTGALRWLDNDKYIGKQTGSHHDMSFRFSVKFYTPDPGLLEEEFTRYMFALQIKRDLATGAMPCNINTAALLSAYIAQAEIGDFNYEEFIDHTYLSSIRFVPNQTDELEEKIMEHHKNLVGHTPADADFLLLDTARKVETYGIIMHPARDHEGVPLLLSVAHMGVLVFQNNTKINTFSWAKIRKLSFKRRRFLIKLHPEGYSYYKDTVEFFFDSRDDCKGFWKNCIEHHAFFRCIAVKRIPRHKTRILSRGSSFRYSGRTQKQLSDHVRDNFVKRPGFERTVSVRVSSLSVGAKSNKSGTLNSQGTDFSRQMNSSMSSGSRTLDSRAGIQPSSRIETVEVHSDSSHSGSVTLHTPPSEKIDQSEIVKKDHVFAEVHVEKTVHANDAENNGAVTADNNNTSSVHVIDTYAINLSANQNANDNEKLSRKSSSESVQLSTVLHIDEDELMNRKNEELSGGVSAGLNGGVNETDGGQMNGDRVVGISIVGNEINGEVDVVNDNEYDSECRHGSGVKTDEDIQYILHRRPMEPNSENIAHVVLGNQSHLTTTRPPVEFSTFRVPSPNLQCVSPPSPNIWHTSSTQEDTASPKLQINTSLPSSSSRGSSLERSPKSPRQRFDFVRVNKLPPKDSFSSADDTVSPSLEKEIMEQFQKKRERFGSSKSEESQEEDKQPLSFSTFRPPPPRIEMQGPTPTSPKSHVFPPPENEDLTSDSSSESEDEGEHVLINDSGHAHVYSNPFVVSSPEKFQILEEKLEQGDGDALSFANPYVSVSPRPTRATVRVEYTSAYVVSSQSAQIQPPSKTPVTNLESYFQQEGASPIPFADSSPIPFADASPIPFADASPIPFADASPIPFADSSPVPFEKCNEDIDVLPPPPPEAYAQIDTSTPQKMTLSTNIRTGYEALPDVPPDIEKTPKRSDYENLGRDDIMTNSSSSGGIVDEHRSPDRLANLESGDDGGQRSSDGESSDSDISDEVEMVSHEQMRHHIKGGKASPSQYVTSVEMELSPKGHVREQNTYHGCDEGGFFSNPYAESLEDPPPVNRQSKPSNKGPTFSSFGH